MPNLPAIPDPGMPAITETYLCARCAQCESQLPG